MKTILSPEEIHTVKYYYKFFDSIPEEKWCKGFYFVNNNTYCAMGLLKVNKMPLEPLQNIIGKVFSCDVENINDGERGSKTEFTHPKTNILNALKQCIGDE